ncbi:MAG: 23S rRNA (pseudouridine(1915)-N(3))-methyltransferase RlmH [Clostridiales bacterium]|nr:23S rRNA (pseudouridine(1915)-N(3))-methyltransferase RlmH [Clostridiales bacterium]
MMSITVIAVGKLKESYLRDGCKEYIKRLGAFAKVNIVEISEERASDNPSDSEIERLIEKEGERILQKIPKGATVIPLCIEGRQYSSEEFADLTEKISLKSSSICFIIGGSFGLSDRVKVLGDYKLSFGKMTLPHQLARMVLLEQIYRAFSILNHSKYHK